MRLPLTGSQTVGPFFSIGLSHLQTHEVPSLEVTSGTGVEVSGVLLDGEYRPIPDAALEIWQSDAQGDYAAMQVEGGRCTGFARVAVDYEGRFHFATEIPGRVAGTEQGTGVVVNGVPTRNYVSAFPAVQNAYTADLRLDHHFNTATSVFLRLSYNPTTTTTRGILPPKTVGNQTVYPVGTVSGNFTGTTMRSRRDFNSTTFTSSALASSLN